MESWDTHRGEKVWAWRDRVGAEYRAIWSGPKGTVELLRSVSAGETWPTVAVVEEIRNLYLAKRIVDSWYSLIYHMNTVR